MSYIYILCQKIHNNSYSTNHIHANKKFDKDESIVENV